MDLLGVVSQAQNADQASFDRYTAALRSHAEGPLDPVLAEARQHRAWAKTALLTGNAEEAKAFVKRAEYLEFCIKMGIPTE